MKSKLKKGIIQLSAVSAGHFINDFYMNIIPPILFLFQRQLSLTLTEQGVIAFVITSAGAFAQPFVGHFADTKGKPWLIILSVSWIAIWMSISGLISNYYLLILIVGIAALASALFHPMGSALAIQIGKKSRGRNLSVFMTVGRFAAFVSPVVALPLVNRYGLKSLAFLMIPGFIVSLFMYLARVQNLSLENNGKKASLEEMNILKVLFHSGVLKWVASLVFIAATRFLILRSLITYGVQYLVSNKISMGVAGVVITLYLLFNSFGVITGGFTSDKIGERKTFILFNILATLAALSLTFSSGYILIFFFIVLGFTLSAGNAVNVVLTHDFLPDNINMASGLIMGLAGGMGGLGILLFGKIADSFNLNTTMMLILIPLVLVVLLSIALPQNNIDKKEGVI